MSFLLKDFAIIYFTFARYFLTYRYLKQINSSNSIS